MERKTSEAGAQSFKARLSALEAMGQQATPRTPLLRRTSSRLGSMPATPDPASSQSHQEAAAAAVTPNLPASARGGVAQLSSAPASAAATSVEGRRKGSTPGRRRLASHDGVKPTQLSENGDVHGRGSRSLFRDTSAPVWPPQVQNTYSAGNKMRHAVHDAAPAGHA